MARRTYRYSFSARDIRKAAKRLQDKGKSLEQSEADLVKKLSDIGVAKAEEKYSNTKYAGNTKVDVEVYQTSRGTVSIRAKGDGVLYMEFGSGVNSAAYPAPLPPGIAPHGGLSTPNPEGGHPGDGLHHNLNWNGAGGVHWVYRGRDDKNNATPFVRKRYHRPRKATSEELLADDPLLRQRHDSLGREYNMMPGDEYEEAVEGMFATKGNDPDAGMYYARLEMEKYAPEIAKEVIQEKHD